MERNQIIYNEQIINELYPKPIIINGIVLVPLDECSMIELENEKRHQQIVELVESLNELNEIQRDLSELVTKQSEQICIIEKQVEKSEESVERAYYDLKQTETNYFSGTKKKLMLLVGAVGAVCVPIVGLKIGIPIMLGSSLLHFTH